MPAFNPYHQWLGIPLEEGPLDFYRLLGLPAFEADTASIEQAAQQQLQRLQSHLQGPTAETAKRIASEVTRARLCLIDPHKKAIYDQSLRQRFAAPAATQKPPAGPGAAGRRPPPVPMAAPTETPTAPPSNKALWIATAALTVLVIASVATLLALRTPPKPTATEPAAAAKSAEPAAAPAESGIRIDWPEDQRDGATLVYDDRSLPVLSKGDITWTCPPGEHRLQMKRNGFKSIELVVQVEANQIRAVQPQWQAEEKSVMPVAEARPAVKEPVAPELVEPAAAQTLGNEGGPAWQFRWGEVAGATRYHLAVDGPTGSLIDKNDLSTGSFYFAPPRAIDAERCTGWQWRVRALVGDQWTAWSPSRPFEVAPPPKAMTSEKETKTAAAATIPAASSRLAVPSDDAQKTIGAEVDEVFKLASLKRPEDKLKAAQELLDKGKQSDKPDERFVLLRRSMELACEGGDAKAMLASIEAIAAGYEVDALSVKVKMLHKCADNATTAPRLASLVEASGDVLDATTAADRYDLAEALATTVFKACQRPVGREYLKDARDRRAEIERLAKPWQEFHDAQEVLKTKPDDAEANLSAGRWYCLAKNDYAKGLPYLAQGSDATLRDLAVREAGKPASTNDKLSLAEAWSAAALERKAPDRDALLAHAAQWYETALADCDSATVKMRIEKRLEEVNRQLDAAAKANPRLDRSSSLVKLNVCDDIIRATRGTYRSQRLPLAPALPLKLKNQPKFASRTPWYGLLALGLGANSQIALAIDEPDATTSKIYIDRNGDHDLNNDGSGAWAENNRNGLYLNDVVIDVPYDRRTIPTHFSFHRYRENNRENLVYYHSASGRLGEILSAGKKYGIALIDNNSNGRYDDLDQGRLLIDLNQDGRLDGDYDSAETHKPNEPFNIHGKVWEVAGLTPDGLQLRLRPSKTNVPMRQYLDPGYPAPPFVSMGLQGEKIDLRREAAGAKYVLLDFWASWCGPCKEELPNVVRAARQYKNSGLKVIGVCLDSDRAAAVGACASFSMDYAQAYDGQGWKNAVAQLYRVHGIPATFLVDKDLKIVARDLRGKQLAQQLQKLLGPGDEGADPAKKGSKGGKGFSK